MRKTIIAGLLVVVMGMLLAGCSGKVEFKPEESSIFIHRDGKVTGYTREDGYDKSYYSLDELKNDYVVPAVAGYNTSQAGLAFAYADETEEQLPVSIEQLEFTDGVAKMRLEYATAADYLAFNENQLEEDALFTVCAIADASSGSRAAWVKCSDGSSVDSATALAVKKNYYFVELNFASVVQVEGTLVYLTDNAMKVNGNTFLSDGSETVYAVFKK